MKITFDIPDDTKAFHVCLVTRINDSFNLNLVTCDIATEGLKDGMIINVPSKEGESNDEARNEEKA